jgi:23S rRNA (cytosine1962-C5)-methyltransferase
MQLLTPLHWKDYELIDAGEGSKLERFGAYISIRPEPQAIWDSALNKKEWERLAHVKFVAKASSSGIWQKLKPMPDQWQINYGLNSKGNDGATTIKKIVFRLGLTSFKHVGIFPEQAVNWDYIFDAIQRMKTVQPKVLNLFAYTGGASLAAKAAGADVTHVDSIKQVISWGRENMDLSGLKDIRWVVEDALTFVKREVKRGRKYQGIILDPPAYGHGPNGESWKLEDQINDMLKNVKLLLDEEENFLILNTYSLGFSSLIIENLLKNFKGIGENDFNTGELFLKTQGRENLPLGVFGRMHKLPSMA